MAKFTENHPSTDWPPPHTEDELRQLAVDCEERRVFLSIFLPRQEDVPLHFTHLWGLPDAELNRIKAAKATVCYEHISKALPTARKGMPTFTSCRFLRHDEVVRLWDLIKAYRAGRGGAAV